jgi:NAD(P)-dependent dehydrogenase (short-subunit alcohol dehydrogenase family)
MDPMELMNGASLEGKTAIVTGGGQGMGRAMALGLLRAGLRVAIAELDGAALADVAAVVRGAGKDGALLTIVADVTQEESAAGAVKQTVETFGRIDILVNNAGIGQETIRPTFMRTPVKFWEVEPARWRRILEINTNAPHFMARAAAPSMIAQKWGRIINVTTSLDTMIRGGFAPYGPSKAANEAYVAIMAQDLAGTGVTANVLVPGGPANTRMIPEESGIDRAALIQPEIMVPPLLWLASAASNGVSGRRFIAALWDPRLPASQAAEKAGAAAAWPSLGRQAIYPKA